MAQEQGRSIVWVSCCPYPLCVIQHRAHFKRTAPPITFPRAEASQASRAVCLIYGEAIVCDAIPRQCSIRSGDVRQSATAPNDVTGMPHAPQFGRVVHTPNIARDGARLSSDGAGSMGAGMKIIVAIGLLFALPGSAFAQRLPPPVPTITAVMSGSGSASASSWLAGAQAGYNWQSGSLVYGLEADISATRLRSEFSTLLQSPTFPTLTAAANAGSNIDWYGTVRGRLGWSAGPLLFYGTGGLAYGDVGLHSTISANPLVLSSATSPLKAGWVGGGGIDYMLSPNIILSLGYQYVDLGRVKSCIVNGGFWHNTDSECQCACAIPGGHLRNKLAASSK